jgi:arginyl-tRNA synthetase
MKLIKQKLIKEINAILKTTFAATDLGDPPKIEMGEFTLPCFELAKIEKKNPAQIALEFAVKLIDHKIPWLENVQAVGPYLNFFIKPEVWAKAVLFDLIKEKKLKLKKSQKIMIEFASLNTHKQTHVGHLRNVVLGEALVKFYRYLGFNVVPACYIGDIGTHVAKCLWNYMKNHAADELPTNKGKYLGEIYIEASNLIAENEVLKTEVSEVLQRLEAREKFITKVWQETREWSLEELRGIYDEMNTKFDVWFFESEEEAKADRVINKLVKDKNIPEIRKSEGAIIADLEKYDLGVLVLIKADGTKAYGAKDIALAIKKFKKFKLDKSIMVVDNRQSLYFKQIFKILELTGHDIKKMKHVPYDFVTTPQGAMASRKGNVIPYEDFRDLMLDKLIEKTKERHPDWPAAKLDDAAAAVALSAMKFGMLKYENNSVVVFDMDAAISTEGATGPYLLYTVARFNSILRKVTPAETTGKLDLSLLNSIEEKDLLKHLSKFEDAIEGCAKLYDPSGMCTYLLELSQKLNTFYHKHQILKADKDVKHARLVLVNVALAVMKRGLKLLNIETVEEM